jgi:hypothetical protein
MSISQATCFRLHATYRQAAAERSFLLHSRRTHSNTFKLGTSAHLRLVQSLPDNRLYHITAVEKRVFSRVCTEQRTSALLVQLPASSFSTAQTHSIFSRSRPRTSTHISYQAQAQNILGSFLTLRKGFCSSTARPSNNLHPSFPKSFLYQSFRLPPSNSATMSTLSQPQTPSALNSPLREHRHRPVERLTDRLETTSLDDRSYRVVRLPNQLEVLLVHDGETDKASAAMDVNVGNFSDEDDFSGMAHAVEVNPIPLLKF